MAQENLDLQYLKLSKFGRFWWKVAHFFTGIPGWFKNLGISIFKYIKKFFAYIGNIFLDVFYTFKNGDWKTRMSFFIMGFGSIARGQILRGLLFFIFEAVFIFYMIFAGGHWLSLLPSLGETGPEVQIYDPDLDTYISRFHDNSFKILLYGVLTIFFIIALIYAWYINIKQNKISQEILANKKKLKTAGDDIKSLVDNEFHKTLLALPTLGIIVFMVLPIVFMILVAFTNYDGMHNGYTNALWDWMGMKNFATIFDWSTSTGAYSAAFGEIVTWTLIWAFFATFSNYFLGSVVAMMINKKGIKLKKLWRTILVLTIAIPQFISLIYVAKMFAYNGIINNVLGKLFNIAPIHFLDDSANKWVARGTVIVINIWIGIPYLMLIVSGILMNIPQDLYESSKIDGASGFQQFSRITLPYMLFVTGPYLLTSFTGNMNNFNVIYLLTGGAPIITGLSGANGNAGSTDLLVTWLFKITTGTESSYYMASVIGILIFVIVAVISLVVYNILPSNKNEEDFQ